MSARADIGGCIAVGAGLLAFPALAAPETWACALAGHDGTMTVQVVLDPAVLSDPVATDEPQRRWTARVSMAGEAFEAEALLTEDGWRGFHRGAEGLMLTKAPDGAARLTRGTAEWTGQCKET